MAVAINRKDVLEEVKEKLGIVPTWFQEMTDEALPGFWSLMKDFYLAETRIPNKYKELIGLAVSGATRCKYCQLFHVEAARLFGATDEEIAEASQMGAMTMMASTFLNAQAVDYDQFRDETRQVVEYVRKQMAAQSPPGKGARPEERARH